MLEGITFSDIINYVIVGAVFVACFMVINPWAWQMLAEQELDLFGGIIGISLLYSLGFLMMIINEMLEAMSRTSNGDDHQFAKWCENFYGMYFLPGAKFFCDKADEHDTDGEKLVVKYFECNSLSDEQTQNAYWQLARSVESASAYIQRLRVLHVFSRNLSTAFGVCAIIGMVQTYRYIFPSVFQELFFLFLALLCLLFRFGSDRLISDRNNAMYEAVCFRILTAKKQPS